MNLTIIPTVAPYGEVAINAAQVAAITPSATAGEDDAEIKLAGGRSVYVLLKPRSVADALGATFVMLERPTPSGLVPFFVNPDQVAEIIPTTDDVCAVVAGGVVYPAKGTFQDVLAKF